MLSKYTDNMRIFCKFCHTEIIDQFFVRCSVSRCSSPYYHDFCSPGGSYQNATNWICPNCTFEFNYGLSRDENNSISLRASFFVSRTRFYMMPGVTEQIAMRQKSFHYGRPDSSSNLTALTDELRAFHVELEGLHEKFESLDNNLVHTDTKIDELFTRPESPGTHAREMDGYQVEILALKNQMARYNESLKNQIELVGIPEREDEDYFAMVRLAAQKIGVRFHEDDLDWAARYGPYPLTGLQSRPVVVRFLQKFKRDQFLRAGKATRNLMTSDLNVNCYPRRVYINERLSQEVRCLFHEARFRSRRHGFKFCWIANNSVFVRKSEGHPAVRLLSQNDLNIQLGDDLTPEREESVIITEPDDDD